MNDPTLGKSIDRLQRACEQVPVAINFETWLKYPRLGLDPDHPITSLERKDLVDTAGKIEWSASGKKQDQAIEHLFVRTMMWGSGTTNGRGPRYTEMALASGRVPSVLRGAREHLLLGQIAEAYYLDRQLPGIGPAFFTKLLWVIGKRTGVSPQPLILDALVWASLRTLKWDSRTASGSRRWGDRYVAYLRACEGWAEEGFTPEDVEYTLFLRAREEQPGE